MDTFLDPSDLVWPKPFTKEHYKLYAIELLVTKVEFIYQKKGEETYVAKARFHLMLNDAGLWDYFCDKFDKPLWYFRSHGWYGVPASGEEALTTEVVNALWAPVS